MWLGIGPNSRPALRNNIMNIHLIYWSAERLLASRHVSILSIQNQAIRFLRIERITDDHWELHVHSETA
jgi:hypothetical protein